MASFNLENPVVILLTAIIVFLMLRATLSKILGKTGFGKKHSDFVSAMITIIGLLMITSIPFLRMVSHSVPYLVLTFVLVALVILVFISMGVEQGEVMKGVKKFLSTSYLWILVILIIAWGASMIWGQQLLEKDEPNTPLTGFSAAEEQTDKYDFSFIFTKPLLGFMLVFLVIGLAFHAVTRTVMA